MMQFFSASTFLLVMLALASPSAGQPVAIRLHAPTADCHEELIRIEHVATLQGGSSQLRNQIKQLDLDEFGPSREPVVIQRNNVRYRILMAGIDPSRFIVTGPPATIAHWSEPIQMATRIGQSLADEITRQYRLPPDSIEVTLTGSLPPSLDHSTGNATSLKFHWKLPVELPIGNRNFGVLVTDGEGKTITANIGATIAVYRELVMAKQNISRGEILSPEKIERVRRPVNRQQVRFASFDQTIGKEAQTDIQQFSLIQPQFIRTPAARASQFDVTRNARLNVLVKHGPLTVTLQDAKAIENGSIGDYIDLINPKSNKRIRARIVNASTAVIEY